MRRGGRSAGRSSFLLTTRMYADFISFGYCIALKSVHLRSSSDLWYEKEEAGLSFFQRIRTLVIELRWNRF